MHGIRSLQHQRGLAVIGSLCLVLQLAVWSPLLPLATALIAWMDGGHTIRFTASGDETHVELRHERGVVGWELIHHHTPLIQSLVCFSKPSNSGEADHILAFSTIGSVSASGSLLQRLTLAERGLQEGQIRADLAALSLRESMQLLAGVRPERAVGLPKPDLPRASTRSFAVELAGTAVLTI
jgi:hypothetical protein